MAPFGSLPQTPGRVLGCCAICGEFVGPQSASIGPGIRAADIFKSSTEWKQCVQKQGYVSGHISELEKVYLRHPWLWTWLYRAILYEPSTDKFRLTGVGFAREAPNGLIQVPAARDHFYICLRLKEEDGIKLTEAFPLGITWARSSQWATQGYPIHERCWTLTTRLLDIRLVKGHLKEFTRALQREWFGMRHYEGDVIEVLRDTDYWGRWLGVCRMVRARNDVEGYLAWTERNLECSRLTYLMRDPLRIHDIPAFLAKEQNRSQNEQGPKKGLQFSCRSVRMLLNRPPRKSVCGHAMRVRSDNPPRKAPALLPELIIQIMDFLPGCHEIRLLLWVYPSWATKVPWSYWRTRFAKDLMLEMDELPDLETLNWQRAYYGIGRLYSTAHGLHNRQRIMERIERIKIAFKAMRETSNGKFF